VNGIALIECFNDTCRLFREDGALQQATLVMQAGTRLFFPGFSAVMPVRKSAVASVTVVEDTTFHCAQGLLDGGKVAILNFANAFTPGGGIKRGAPPQEECLDR